MKTMYCVEHSERDFENSYFESKAEAIEKAKELKELIANDELSSEEIFVTAGEMSDEGDYSVTEAEVKL
jgi:hypothetical protein